MACGISEKLANGFPEFNRQIKSSLSCADCTAEVLYLYNDYRSMEDDFLMRFEVSNPSRVHKSLLDRDRGEEDAFHDTIVISKGI